MLLSFAAANVPIPQAPLSKALCFSQNQETMNKREFLIQIGCQDGESTIYIVEAFSEEEIRNCLGPDETDDHQIYNIWGDFKSDPLLQSRFGAYNKPEKWLDYSLVSKEYIVEKWSHTLPKYTKHL